MSDKKQKNFLLRVPAFFYGIGTRLRNFAFDTKMLSSSCSSIPTICVGNLSAGGTGKTPHVELLVELLRKEYRVAVLTRGYGRKTKQPIIASAKDTPDTIGDEPYQIFRKFPDVMLYVDGDRRRALTAMEAMPDDLRPDVVIMDDGFQHRYITPTFSILLTPFDRPYYEDSLLPYGTLREPASGHRRADSVIVTRTPKDLTAFAVKTTILNLELLDYQEVYFSRVIYARPELLFAKTPTPDRSLLSSSEVLPLAGIADPKPFLDKIRSSFPKASEAILYPDHHAFVEKDLERISSELSKNPKLQLLTTEKDSVRLLKWETWLPEEVRKRIWYLPIKVYLSPDNLSKLMSRARRAIRDNTLHY